MPEPTPHAPTIPARLAARIRRDGDLARLVVITLVVFGVMAALNPGVFVTAANFESMAFQFPELGLLSLAMLLAMLSGGIDLSVVAIANLSGILAATVLTRTLPPDPGAAAVAAAFTGAIAASLACGALCGCVNGLLISRVRITPILATLGTMQLFLGIGLVLTGGRAIFGFPEAFLYLGNGQLLGLPLPFLLFATACVVIATLSSRSLFGIRLRLSGANLKAALYSGIPVTGVLFKTYLLTGLVSATAGLVMIARTNSAKADYGSSYLLQAILVAVLGGVSPTGGFGKVSGVVIAVFALQLLASGFNMLHLSNFVTEFTWGAFLLVVIVLNALRQKQAAR